MIGTSLKLLRALHERRERGEHAILVTVVKTWPGSPWPEGSMMAIQEDGTTDGQVAGGCIEEDLVLRFLRWQEMEGYAQVKPAVMRKLIQGPTGRPQGAPEQGEIVVLLEFDPHLLNIRDTIRELECRELALGRGLHDDPMASVQLTSPDI